MGALWNGSFKCKFFYWKSRGSNEKDLLKGRVRSIEVKRAIPCGFEPII